MLSYKLKFGNIWRIKCYIQNRVLFYDIFLKHFSWSFIRCLPKHKKRVFDNGLKLVAIEERKIMDSTLFLEGNYTSSVYKSLSSISYERHIEKTYLVSLASLRYTSYNV